MSKISTRFKFALTIGLAIFIFSIIMMLAYTNIISSTMQDSIDKLEANISYVESKSSEVIKNDVDNSLKEEAGNQMAPSLNSAPAPKETVDRSAESYRVALTLFNDTYRRVIYECIIWSFVFGFIGFILAYPLSGLLLRPFRKLANDISNINEANLNELLYIENPKDETGKIKLAFNKLLVRVSTVLDRQSSFTSNVTHELKTPLSVMKIYPETLDEDSTIDEYKEVIAIEKKNVDRMIELVNDLLEYSRDIDIKATIINVEEVIDKDLEALRPLIEQKKIKIHKDISDLEIVTSRELFERLTYNILSNATRYNKDGGDIYITYRPHELSIRDTGIGIPEDSLEHLFEPLYCVDKSRSRELGGSGLGLAIVKKIADTLGYKIEVSSKVDKGTEFTIKI